MSLFGVFGNGPLKNFNCRPAFHVLVMLVGYSWDAFYGFFGRCGVFEPNNVSPSKRRNDARKPDRSHNFKSLASRASRWGVDWPIDYSSMHLQWRIPLAEPAFTVEHSRYISNIATRKQFRCRIVRCLKITHARRARSEPSSKPWRRLHRFRYR